MIKLEGKGEKKNEVRLDEKAEGNFDKHALLIQEPVQQLSSKRHLDFPLSSRPACKLETPGILEQRSPFRPP